MGISSTIKITRSKPELVTPVTQTPYQWEELSDVDDQLGLRFYVPVLLIYRRNPSMIGRDPALAIREALAKALVFYYPLAGRLREGSQGKLTVECNGEGALFVQADADTYLDQFGDQLHPPLPHMGKFLYDCPGVGEVLDTPLVSMQVTRFACGGFIVGIRMSHNMCDGTGLAQFLTVVGEMSRGLPLPITLPVWQRELLNARSPPRITYSHPEFEEPPLPTEEHAPLFKLVHRSFKFTPSNIKALRKQVSEELGQCTSFELVTACLWKCRTIALGLDPEEDVRLLCVVNGRTRMCPPMPEGYYGNVFACGVAATKAGVLCREPLGYAVELVKKAKAMVTDEYMRSMADLFVINRKCRRRSLCYENTFLVSDFRWLGLGEVDFGWGPAAYGGPAEAIAGRQYYCVQCKKDKEADIVLLISMPGPVLESLSSEIECITRTISAETPA